MFSFLGSLALLIIGYLFYGKIVTRIFSPSDNPTPAVSMADGIDYIKMPTWKVFLIQLLNIAGTGPIFGAIMGACFGPSVYLWIVFGSIFGGAVHDYMIGMMSIRMNGESAAEIVGKLLGNTVKKIMRIFSVVLLILVGAVFTTSPAALINTLTKNSLGIHIWVTIILAYYVFATFVPIDKVIGKVYPVFGAILISMAICIVAGLFIQNRHMPEITFSNLHPYDKPIFPFMFITVACGAISGFHSTQSPLMARCISSEHDGRKVFYGAMIAEGAIALAWAAAGVTYYNSTGSLLNKINELGDSGVVYDIATGLLGTAGGILTIIGVVICPISSGDTAYRSARLTIADWFDIDQKSFRNRMLITIPLIISGLVLSRINFNVLWRYFSWSNQSLATIVLWTSSIYLINNAKKKRYSLITVIPAVFMSMVTSSYILTSKEGFRLPYRLSIILGIVFALIVLASFSLYVRKSNLKNK